MMNDNEARAITKDGLMSEHPLFCDPVVLEVKDSGDEVPVETRDEVPIEALVEVDVETPVEVDADELNPDAIAMISPVTSDDTNRHSPKTSQSAIAKPTGL